jgi:hypothetical protein
MMVDEKLVQKLNQGSAFKMLHILPWLQKSFVKMTSPANEPGTMTLLQIPMPKADSSQEVNSQ